MDVTPFHRNPPPSQTMPTVLSALAAGRCHRGFTLVELMIAISVLSILSAVALPSYRDYVSRGKIPQATSRLATRQATMERFFQDNRAYNAAGSTGCAAENPTNAYFDFSCSTQTANAFVLVATGKDSMAGFEYTVDQNDVKQTTSVPSGWSLPSPNNCWVTKRGGAC